MRSKEVLSLLKVTRKTLVKYAQMGKIGVKRLSNGYYDYSEEDVFKLLNKGKERATLIYARVPVGQQESELQNQIESIKQFCTDNEIQVDGIYSDIANGLSFEGRVGFAGMLDEIMTGKVKRIIVIYRDRLTRVDFSLVAQICKHFACRIMVIGEIGPTELSGTPHLIGSEF
jgi:predicted site-specific integrase-resolvase